jgi:hypothetical protein
MIDFLLDDGDTATCPAKILGFVRYNITSGIPTPHISGYDGLSNEIPNNESVDHNFYMVVHITFQLINFKTHFITLFTLGKIETCLCIVDVDAICGPLFVFQNYGSDTNDKKRLFCALPQSKWGQYFDNMIF